MRTRTRKKETWLIALNVVVVAGLLGLSGYLYNENNNLREEQNLTSEQKNERLVAEINEVFDLPDEEPVVAIVTDPDQFRSEYPTFESAQSGDYLLFFRKARLNVLYRQSEKRVLQTANVVVPIAVELVGSQAAIDTASELLADFGDQIAVTSVVTNGITQAFVFDVDSDQTAEAESIAEQLSVDVGTTLPSTISPDEQTEIVIAVTEKTPSTVPDVPPPGQDESLDAGN